ncbi:DUF6506 family protein [Enemella evansiae]|uniref:DUF6506 family protein n=1 Tax=Enemella evansiae TaxID=2016499 RepID=UPI001E6284D6|nr:DUF6506 family protein [Enemella evansiae]
MTTDVTDQRAPLTWAAILEHPGADPVRDRHELTAPGIRALIVPVPSGALAAEVARDLADEGVRLIELCGGITTADVAAVQEAVGDRVAVGHVLFSVEALAGAAAYARSVQEN